MKSKQSFMIFVLLCVAMLPRGFSKHVGPVQSKRMLGGNSISSDINQCLFQYWTPFVGKNKENAPLEKLVSCKLTQLCYGVSDIGAQFAVCYNQKTLIPEFTGHVVKPNIGGQGRENGFRHDTTIDPVAKDEDYAKTQFGLYFNYDSAKNQFFARGHLTPNADFSTEAERTMTMVTTNIAPQWQLFNGGNWQRLEAAVRGYATQTKHALYIFTGTGDAATNLKGQVIWLNKKVLAPKYYWKAVCDPIGKQSVFFWGENTIGDMKDKDGDQEACCDKLQTKREGIICCSSLSDAKNMFKKIFQIPEFHTKNCVPSVSGSDLKSFVTKSLT